MKVRLYIKVLYSSPFACDTEIFWWVFVRKEDTEDIKVVRSDSHYYGSSKDTLVKVSWGSSVRVASCKSFRDNCCSSVYALFLYVRHYEIKIDI